MPKKHQFPVLDLEHIDAQSPEKNEGLLDIPQAAQFLGIANSSMRRLQADRYVPFYKIGRCVRFSRKDLEAYVAKRRVEPIDWDKF
jgi:excisionase family DNA binding protein